MITKRSPLDLKEVFILQTHIEVGQPPQGEDVSIDSLFSSYSIEVDFGLRQQSGHHVLATKIGINHNHELPGYSIMVECLGFYNILSEISDAEKAQIIVSNGLAINLSFLRAYIASQTSNYPMGKYWLPGIDASDLITQKRQQQTVK